VKTQLKLSSDNLLQALSDPRELKRLRNVSRSKNLMGAPLTPEEKDMADWLGRLKLLHGVPFHYLVPDNSMLPIESIRFFYMDSVWLDYLVEGALSLGRSTSGDSVHDQAFLGEVHHFSRFGVKAQRSNVLGHLSFHLNHTEKALLTSNAEPVSPTEKITGFLLRSGVVSGWEGLQVEAFMDEEAKQNCQLLRMDHLSSNVLLCIFEGEAKRIIIHEYPEVLHFGVKIINPTTFVKSFRYIVGKDGHAAGTQVDAATAPPMDVSRHLRIGSRVVRMSDLANAMHTEVKEKIAYTGPFTAAEFALQMVQGVQAVNFRIDTTQ
jgi:hypothetical protein